MLTVLAFPSVHTDTVVTTRAVSACATMFAYAGMSGTLVHVLLTVLADVATRTLTRVRAQTIQATTAVLAAMTLAVVNVHVTMTTRVARSTRAVVCLLTERSARGIVHTRRWLTWYKQS